MKKFIFILLFISIISTIVRIVVSTSTITAGIDLTYMQEQKNLIEKENMLLKEEIYQKSALTTLNEEAKTSGFVAVTRNSNLTISNSIPVAYRQ